MANRTQILCLAVVFLAAATSPAQQAQAPAPVPSLYKAIGKATVNGSPSLTSTNLYVDQNVATDAESHLHVIARGNTLIFTPNTQFVTRKNAFRLDSGGSKVASYTGMTAYLPNCFAVAPVDPNLLTVFEVNWSGQEAYVYARSQDVRIKYYRDGATENPAAGQPENGNWVVKEGHTARISDVAACKPLVYVWPESGVPLEATAAVAASVAGPAAGIILWNEGGGGKPKMSQDTP